ncbi:hypothetical protein L7F22_047630 [Adiantum nelumboides]|nr:hypothetical protein [Adiantum nelumboides]
MRGKIPYFVDPPFVDAKGKAKAAEVGEAEGKKTVKGVVQPIREIAVASKFSKADLHAGVPEDFDDVEGEPEAGLGYDEDDDSDDGSEGSRRVATGKKRAAMLARSWRSCRGATSLAQKTQRWRAMTPPSSSLVTSLARQRVRRSARASRLRKTTAQHQGGTHKDVEAKGRKLLRPSQCQEQESGEVEQDARAAEEQPEGERHPA